MEGHKKGADNFKVISKAAFKSGVKYMTAFVFSSENWNRSKEEVAYLMDLFIWLAKSQVAELDKENIRVCFIGEDTRLSDKVIKAMRNAEERTKDNTAGTILFCLNYGGQQEIASAVNQILKDDPQVKEVTPELIEQNLYQPDVPPLDLIIRTSGEQRISNFMLWRAAYSELYFANVHWPAFSEDDLQVALDDYAHRQRRFGK